MSCLTGETSVSGIEPETCSTVFSSPHQGAGPFLSDLQFKVGSEPPGAKKTLRKNPLVLAGIEPGPSD